MLWGEAPAEGARNGSSAGARGRGACKEAAYAFDAGAEALAAVFESGGGRSAQPGRERQKPIRRGPQARSERARLSRGSASRVTRVTAWLPAVGGSVIPSSALVGEPPGARGKPALAAQRVTAIALSRAEAVDFLCACCGREMLAPGVVVGADLAWWTDACRMAGSIVARQQYLPDLVEEQGSFRARWEPLYSASDARAVTALAGRMPGVARALAGEASGEGAPQTPAEDVVRAFLAEIVDHLVRSCVRGLGEPQSVHERWIEALLAVDGRVEGTRRELAALQDEVRSWRRAVALGAAAPLRLCLRLEEPQDDGADDGKVGARRTRTARARPWQVSYLLQPLDDPSLLLPAAEAWRGRGRAASLLRRGGVEPHEFLLASLGQAAALCPRIEQSLGSAQPEGYELDSSGAHEFLTQRAAALETAGFGVMLPAWWTRKGTKLRLAARAAVRSPRMKEGANLSLDELVQVEWEVALGEDKISLSELDALAALKEPLVQVRGQWVELSAAEIEAAASFWKGKPRGEAPLAQVLRMALGAGNAPGEIVFGGVQASGWVGDLLRQLQERTGFEELPVSGGFSGELRPYQVRGYSWLAFLRRFGLGACLADDMGLGKTIQTLALLQCDWDACAPGNGGREGRGGHAGRRKNNGWRPMLLVCPTSVVGNWRKEAERFTPSLPVLVHHGAQREKGAAFARTALRQALVITSYALLHRDAELLNRVEWSGVVLDEAQNIKNPETLQARAARSLRGGFRVALTGTPVENNVGDLWSIMEFLNPGWLGSQAEFRRRFFVPIQTERDAEAAERLRRITGPFILRRLKTDRTIIRDLPEKLEMKVYCTLTREQASLYAAVLKDAEKALHGADGIQRRGVVLATLSKLKQVCNHPAQFLGDNSSLAGRSGKLARLVEMLEEVIAAGDAGLVFSQFSEMGALVKRHLEESFGRETLFLHGGVTARQREKMVERFQEKDGPAVLVLSLKAGGTGLNLTRASHVFHFDRWWNPAVENQATDRAFRIGQRRNVQVHKFLCAGTLEEKIDEMIERKKGVAENIVGAGEAWLTELSNEELRDVFALRSEAVGE